MQVLNFYHLGKKIPDSAVYIGREMPNFSLKGSKFANPFKLSEDETRETTIERYRKWLWEQIKLGNISIDDLLSLDGKDLVCYCSPKPCHGDVLVNAVEWAKSKGCK